MYYKQVFFFFQFVLCLVNITNAQQMVDSIIIYFDFNKYDLINEEKSKLESFTRKLQDYKIENIVIEGHCDSIGSIIYNQQLSKNRCIESKKLIENNLKGAKATLKPYGKSRPIEHNNSETGRAKNRRTKIIISYSKNSFEKNPSPKNITIEGKTISEGKSIVLKNLNFEGGRHILLPSSSETMQELIKIMKENPTLEIEIQGHICCSPPDEDGYDYDSFDNNLSTNRAKSIYDMLCANGIDAARMKYIGMKGNFPLVKPEVTEADQSTNRRVEIKVLKM